MYILIQINQNRSYSKPSHVWQTANAERGSSALLCLRFVDILDNIEVLGTQAVQSAQTCPE